MWNCGAKTGSQSNYNKIHNARNFRKTNAQHFIKTYIQASRCDEDRDFDLVNAVWHSDFSAVQACLNNGADVNQLGDIIEYNGAEYTPLQLACEIGLKEIVEFLICRGAKLGKAGAGRCSLYNRHGGDAPLVLAWQNCHKDIVELLLDHGATLEQPIQWSNIQDFCKKGHLDIAELLLERGYALSCSYYHLEVAELLMKRGYTLPPAENEYDWEYTIAKFNKSSAVKGNTNHHANLLHDLPLPNHVKTVPLPNPVKTAEIDITEYEPQSANLSTEIDYEIEEVLDIIEAEQSNEKGLGMDEWFKIEDEEKVIEDGWIMIDESD